LRARELLRASAGPLAVLLDWRMPLLDGHGLLQLALAEGRPLTRHAYAVVSGQPDDFPPAFGALLRHFAIPVLAKPLERAALLEAVARLAARLQSLRG